MEQQPSDALPLGFGMALAQHPGALQTFARLSEEKQQQLLDQARGVTSREGMIQLVNTLDAQA